MRRELYSSESDFNLSLYLNPIPYNFHECVEIVVTIDRDSRRFLLQTICMIETCREGSRDGRNNPRRAALRQGTHERSDERRVSAFPRVDDAGGRIGAHTYTPLCAIVTSRFSPSRGFHTDICPTRGYKWTRPIHDTDDRRLLKLCANSRNITISSL